MELLEVLHSHGLERHQLQINDHLIEVNAKLLIKHCICKGYIDLEQYRMQDIDTRCGHLKFKSSEEFCEFCIKTITTKRTEIKNNTKSNKENDENLNYMSSLLANGACKQCCFIMGTYLAEISLMIPSSIYVDGIRKDNKIKRIYNHNLNIATSVWWLTIMQYPHICKYIIRHTVYVEDIWWMFWNPMDRNVLLANRKKQNKECIGYESMNTSFSHISLFGYQIIRNGYILNKNNWRSLVLWYPWTVCWLHYVCQQLEIGIIQNYDMGTGCFGVMVILIFMSYGLSKEIIDERSSLLKKLYDALANLFDTLQKLKSTFDELQNVNIELRVFNEIFLKLKNDDNFRKKICKYIAEKFKCVFKIKWNNVKCQNLKCAVKIGEKKKFYFCSGCLVARYCSRRCQKYDWNINNHKKWCQRYRKLRTQVDHHKITQHKICDLRNGDPTWRTKWDVL